MIYSIFNHKKANKFLLIVPFLLGSFMPGLAQKADFSSTWIIKDKISLTGPDYLNGIPKQIKVAQNDNKITIERVSLNEVREDQTVIETLLLSGKTFETLTANKRKKTAKLVWSDKSNQFKIVTNFSYKEKEASSEYMTTETWTLQDSGNTLVIVKSFESFREPADKWSMKGIYEKQ